MIEVTSARRAVRAAVIVARNWRYRGDRMGPNLKFHQSRARGERFPLNARR